MTMEKQCSATLNTEEYSITQNRYARNGSEVPQIIMADLIGMYDCQIANNFRQK